MSVAEFRARGAKANKFSATAIVCDGQRFDSKLERDRYLELKNLWQIGAIAWFTRQVPFQLPGGITYRADFLVCRPVGCARWRYGDTSYVEIEDCKGFMTPVSANKIKQVEAIYGFKVNIITKKGKRR